MAIITMEALRAMGFSEERAKIVLEAYRKPGSTKENNNNKTIESEVPNNGKRN